MSRLYGTARQFTVDVGHDLWRVPISRMGPNIRLSTPPPGPKAPSFAGVCYLQRARDCDWWHAACRRHSMDCLTRRERAILADVSEGLTDKEIALRRHISVGTVKNHLSNAKRKLDVRTRVELALHAQADELEGLRRWHERELSRRAEYERVQCELQEQVDSLQEEVSQLRKWARVADSHKGDRYLQGVLDWRHSPVGNG